MLSVACIIVKDEWGSTYSLPIMNLYPRGGKYHKYLTERRAYIYLGLSPLTSSVVHAIAIRQESAK